MTQAKQLPSHRFKRLILLISSVVFFASIGGWVQASDVGISAVSLEILPISSVEDVDLTLDDEFCISLGRYADYMITTLDPENEGGFFLKNQADEKIAYDLHLNEDVMTSDKFFNVEANESVPNAVSQCHNNGVIQGRVVLDDKERQLTEDQAYTGEIVVLVEEKYKK